VTGRGSSQVQVAYHRNNNGKRSVDVRQCLNKPPPDYTQSSGSQSLGVPDRQASTDPASELESSEQQRRLAPIAPWVAGLGSTGGDLRLAVLSAGIPRPQAVKRS
jgi:hypothetical protein